MDDRADAAMQVFGQIHELSDAIQRRIVARSWEPLCGHISGDAKNMISKKGRQFLLAAAWPMVCEVLNNIEDQEELSSHSRMLLRVCLGHAQHFVGIILHHFYERHTFDRLVSQNSMVFDIFSSFIQFVTKNGDSQIQMHLNVLRDYKEQLNKIRRHLRQAQRLAHIRVHRVSYLPYAPAYHSPSFGKRIVVDPHDLDKFHPDKFYVMHSSNSFVIKAQSSNLEIHLLVTDDCPFDSTKLETIMRQKEHGDSDSDSDYFAKDWMVLVVIYNLQTVPGLQKWLSQAQECLLENINKRSYISRSPNKQNNVLTGVHRSRMVGLGDLANQSGGVGPYLNIEGRRRITTPAKYEILKNSDFILDGLIAV